MLRRTFFKLLAALPFAWKAKNLHFSRVNKPEDWTALPFVGREPITVAQMNAMLQDCTYGPTNQSTSQLGRLLDERLQEWKYLVQGRVMMMLVRNRPEREAFLIRSRELDGGYYASISITKEELDRNPTLKQRVELCRAKRSSFEVLIQDVITTDTRFTLEQKISLLKDGEHTIVLDPRC